MKILLLGEYSNVHATLALGLRRLGHEVVVASDGDGWKDYSRDIDLRRPNLDLLSSLRYLFYLEWVFHSFRDFDIVQIINPVFLPLRAERIWRYYKSLRKRNGRIFMGAFGMDYYYAIAANDCQTFRYSDYNLGTHVRHYREGDNHYRDWVLGPKGQLCQRIAHDCDGIVAGLYEYYAAYLPHFSEKLIFIPFPIIPKDGADIEDAPSRIRFFIGIQRHRTEYKGTDIMLRALERVASEFPDRVDVCRVESVPFSRYCELLNGSHVILDQLYSYTPAMNALEAMARGIIVVGGGEPENYAILGEDHLRPIINVLPNEDNVYEALRNLVLHPERIPDLAAQSRKYILRHHDYEKVAQRYIDFWQHSSKN